VTEDFRSSPTPNAHNELRTQSGPQERWVGGRFEALEAGAMDAMHYCMAKELDDNEQYDAHAEAEEALVEWGWSSY